MKKFIPLFMLFLFIMSCKTKDDVVYFNGVDSKNNIIGIDSYSPTYHKDDELIIIVSAIDAEAARPFNLLAVSYSEDMRYATVGRERLQSYIVDPDGNINFPVLGELKIAGLDRQQATTKLQDILKDYIKDPIVNIRTLNYKITVLGEVHNPGTYTATNERVTLVEALGLAGDMTIHGERENVLVIHDYDGKKTFTRVNLKTMDMFDSPAYYLSQNDVVYVEPNKTQARASGIGASTGVLFSSLGIIISSAALIITIISLSN